MLLLQDRELRAIPATDQAIRGDGPRPLPRKATQEPGKAGRRS